MISATQLARQSLANDAHSAESQESIRAKRCLCSQGSHALRKEGLQLQVSRGVWGMNDAILRLEVGVRV
jgi:hypothetical protein